MTDIEHVLLERGFVLHQRAYRNTSQLLDCITVTHGRVGLVAHGSRRRPNGQSALLQAFAPLRVSWSRRGDLGRLIYVEAEGPRYALESRRLLAAFYVNELLLRLTVRGDPNSDVFSCYSRCLADLAAQASVARTLRLFELSFIRALGYGLELECDTDTGEPLRADRRYVYELERGPRIADASCVQADVYAGRELISLGRGVLDDDACLRAARRLLGRTLRIHLGERPLRSRTVLEDIVDRGLYR